MEALTKAAVEKILMILKVISAEREAQDSPAAEHSTTQDNKSKETSKKRTGQPGTSNPKCKLAQLKYLREEITAFSSHPVFFCMSNIMFYIPVKSQGQ